MEFTGAHAIPKEEQKSRVPPGTPRAPARDMYLSSANERTAELLKTKNHILAQLHEAQRLREIKGLLLEPSERSWIDQTLADVADAVREAAILIEPMRVESEIRNGKLSWGRQLRWIYRDSKRAKVKSQRLLACHHSLMLVLGHLQRVDILVSPVSESPVVHELGAVSLSTNSTYSLYERQGTWPGSNGPAKDTLEVVGAKSPLNYEMHDMLAWRQSKGALNKLKHPVDSTTEELDVRT
ncbi:hypothetical protein PENANT_c014G04736 [Penicillium antarcticum]|uniref:Uncharacterized protein n=1 Tax=Penicillium antarcticum TaxID=416450 RepID=A0A1V6Q4F4_9EURO|nr:uncharacterized protein N7508_009544 [Penicillium antarcticum]KAJ5294723.1 hypothetical protein N7508_009544 [Penicillium antarcticum]OQD84138.1 hypothetical protein PENANT_c014G04736 [Penicillium antarcticum]